jgi:ribosome-associated protein
MKITKDIAIADTEIVMQAVRSSGAGGQNVNKVATAIHLFFDIKTSSLPDQCKERLLDAGDQRVTRDGVIVIKANRYRSQIKNREDAIQRLKKAIVGALTVPKHRKPTRPSTSATEKRLEEKSKVGQLKRLRADKPMGSGLTF